MNERASTRLIGQLVDNLSPVRPVPRLRSAVAALAVGWLALASVSLLSQGARADFWQVATSPSAFSGVLTGLLLLAAGSWVASLAAGRPGREQALRRGAIVASVGSGIALLVGVGGIISLGSAYGAPASADGMCLRAALRGSLIPAIAIGLLVARGTLRWPLLEAALCLAGAAAAGAAVVHLGCPFTGPRHLLMGHFGAPAMAVIVGFLPLGWLLARARR